MVKRFLVAVVCAVALFTSAPAQAAPILVTDSDGVVGTVFFDLLGNPVLMGLSGASGAIVTDGAPVTAGVIAASDSDTGLFVDFDVNDALIFDFDFGTSIFDFGTGLWSLVVYGSPFAISDPALLPFIGANVGQFSVLTLDPFIDGETQQTVGFLGTYALDFIAAQEDVTAVPEPATLGLLGTGLVMAVRRRRTKANKTGQAA